LIGATFSLWRAVFQANVSLDEKDTLQQGLDLLSKVLADNAVTYRDEKYSWSFGYYTNNARFRVLASSSLLTEAERAPELGSILASMQSALSDGRDGDLPRAAWSAALEAVRALISVLEARRD
jgi:hypothetical protein